MHFIQYVSDRTFVKLALSSDHMRTSNPERSSISPHIDRCRNLPVKTGQIRINSCSNVSAVICTKSSRFGPAVPAEVSGCRSGFQLLQVASASRRNCFVVSFPAAGRLTRPTKSRGLRISFTKTSPQQTDPPGKYREFCLPINGLSN